MGINYECGPIQLLQACLRLGRLVLPGLEMAELGNQNIDRQILFPGRPLRQKIVAKHVFEMFGVEHTSFDWNGHDGAVKIDLCKPIHSSYCGQFDVVTNFGTTEHVANQYQVWKNIHDMCRPLGWMLHVLPEKGSFEGHSPYHYTAAWVTSLASRCKYQIHDVHVHNINVADKPDWSTVCALFQKDRGDFPEPKDFKDP